MQSYDEIDYQSLRTRVGRRLARRIAFWIHFFVFFIISMNINAQPGPSSVRDMLMPVWFIVLALHFGWWLYSELIERGVRKEIERGYRRRLGDKGESYGAYVRARAARLAYQNYDGELIDLEDALSDPKAKRKRS